jgi:hypothetical protein
LNRFEHEKDVDGLVVCCIFDPLFLAGKEGVFEGVIFEFARDGGEMGGMVLGSEGECGGWEYEEKEAERRSRVGLELWRTGRRRGGGRCGFLQDQQDGISLPEDWGW